MSRIGKNPIAIPAGVTVEVKDAVVTVKGKLGELTQEFSDVTVKIEGNDVIVERSSDHKNERAKHGLYRSLINNMVVGVSEGFQKDLEIIGVGYKAANQGNILELSLGYSHMIFMAIPSEIKVATAMEKGKNPMVTLNGIDKQLIGQVAAKIKSLRPVEPYKGKGVRFVGEQVRRKAGKAGGKK